VILDLDEIERTLDERTLDEETWYRWLRTLVARVRELETLIARGYVIEMDQANRIAELEAEVNRLQLAILENER